MFRFADFHIRRIVRTLLKPHDPEIKTKTKGFFGWFNRKL